MTVPRVLTAVATTNVTLALATEVEVLQLDGITTGAEGRRVHLHGFVQVTTGTGATGLTLRIRRGTGTGGVLVGEANVVQVEAVAGSTEDHDITVLDTPGELAGESYVLTVQQAAATADGTALAMSLTAIIH